MEKGQNKHFVLIHGACHGAWCWYKLKPLLEKCGHRVTALDMAAAGIHPNAIEEVSTMTAYTQPLLDLLAALPHDERVILVGHSLGGMNLATAMELFPNKIEVAVFLAAFMPDTLHNRGFVFDQFIATNPEGYWLDTEFKSTGDPENSITTMLFGRNFLFDLYHLSPLEDFELAMMLRRPSSLFLHDLHKANKFSKEKYDTVARVYVVIAEDKGISKDFQHWMADNGGVKEVKEIHGDHMAMVSVPQELRDCLLEIAQKY